MTAPRISRGRIEAGGVGLAGAVGGGDAITVITPCCWVLSFKVPLQHFHILKKSPGPIPLRGEVRDDCSQKITRHFNLAALSARNRMASLSLHPIRKWKGASESHKFHARI